MATNSSTLSSIVTTDIVDCTRKARRNYNLYLLFWSLAILSSFFAGLKFPSAEGDQAKFWLSILAAVPGVMMIALDKFNLQRKSNWYWEKAYRLRGLKQQNEYEELSDADFSKEVRNLNIDMEVRWPGAAEGLKAPVTTDAPKTKNDTSTSAIEGEQQSSLATN